MRATEYLNEVGNNGAVEKTFEEYLQKIPTNLLFGAALASIGLSLSLKLSGKGHHALFIGQWAPTFMGMAILRKLVAHDNDNA